MLAKIMIIYSPRTQNLQPTREHRTSLPLHSGHEKPRTENRTEVTENRTEVTEPIGFGS
jgi:hypothetical protein